MHLGFLDGVRGLIAAGGIRQVSDLQSGASQNPLVKFLGSKSMLGLAGFSYSLYLTHHPIVIVLCAFAAKAHVPALISVYGVSLAALIICLPVAYLVSLAVEKPFLRARRAAAAKV